MPSSSSTARFITKAFNNQLRLALLIDTENRNHAAIRDLETLASRANFFICYTDLAGPGKNAFPEARMAGHESIMFVFSPKKKKKSTKPLGGRESWPR